MPYIAVNIDNTLADTSLVKDAIPADLPEEFCLENLKNLFFRVKPYPYAVESMNCIAQGCQIVYTTARPKVAGFVTVRWLAVNGFPKGAVYFVPPQERYFPDAVGVIDDDPRVPQLYPAGWAHRLYVKAHPYNTKVHANRFTSWKHFMEALTYAPREKNSP